MSTFRRRNLRRGLSGVQTAVVLVFVAVAVIVSVKFMGTSTKDELGRTAGDVGDPASLVDRWNNNDNGSGSVACESTQEGD
jgi:hypothetical protein